LANAAAMHRSRTWAHVAPAYARAWLAARAAAAAAPPSNAGSNRERNLGVHLGEWPARARAAADAVDRLPLRAGAVVLDLGCGKQTIRPLLRGDLRYRAVDRLQRTPDTEVMDLASERPAGRFDVAVMLGLLEYLAAPAELLRWALQRARFAVFSYNDCTDRDRRARQHWVSEASCADVERQLTALRATWRSLELGPAERLYVVERAAEPTAPDDPRGRRVALLSAAVAGDNSGDALIEDAIKRLLPDSSFERVPLLQPLSDTDAERVNACDMALICGTNLYQTRLACSLTAADLDRLRVPVVPVGVGGSAALDEPIRMDGASIRLVRAIHDKCEMGSVRDPHSADFLASIGVRNVALTGCPVLFHGLDEPRFAAPEGRVHLSVRARLLHVEASASARAEATLRRLAEELRPVLVTQSPYDQPLAEALATRFALPVVRDPAWQHGALLAALPQVSRAVGFRLHFGMLCLAYGRGASFIGTDTRTASFCAMMSLPHHDIRAYRDVEVLAELAALPADVAGFLRRWRDLRRAMQGALEANGLVTAWTCRAPAAEAAATA
jgi:hypothetical protein